MITAVEIAGVKFKNPVLTASGTFGFGREYAEFYDLSKLGGIMVKGLTLKPRNGNNAPRIAETPAGILNSVGLQNPGIDAFIAEEVPFLRQFDLNIIANIAGNTIEEYCEMAEKIGKNADMIEMNISCPNVKEGGVAFGTVASTVFEITQRVKKCAKIPLIVKLSPNVTDITEMAKAAQSGGADAISLINTLLGMRIDIKTAKPILANNVGGLSGPAVFPVALRMVWQAASAVKIPIIGMGGVSSCEDLIEMMQAGASAVAIGTANFGKPTASADIAEEIPKYMRENGIGNVNDIIGIVKTN